MMHAVVKRFQNVTSYEFLNNFDGTNKNTLFVVKRFQNVTSYEFLNNLASFS